MVEGDVGAVNLDELQAQIELSMSATDDLISSWLKTGSNLAKHGSKNADKELQDYLRRPPRLGVGAPLPESSGVASREEAKLKSKLKINGKKRQRVNDDSLRQNDSESEEEEHRTAVSSATKRARFDPFSVSSKPKKNFPSAPARISQEHAEGSDMRAASVTTVVSVASETQVANTAPGTEGLELQVRKKRKKKKKRNGTISDPTDVPIASGSKDQANSHLLENVTSVHEEEEEEEEEWNGFGDLDVPDTDVNGPKDEGTSSGTEEDLLKDEVAQTKPAPNSPSVVRSLLNLSGPPSEGESDSLVSGSSPKKKRRKRRKKKVTQDVIQQL